MTSELTTIKNDIKSAIESKYVEVNGGMTTYADCIRNIPEIVYLKGKITDGLKLSHSVFSDLHENIEFLNIKDMSYMFAYCENLSSVFSLDTSNTTDMSSMFYGCKNLSLVGVLDAKNVEDVGLMFDECENLSSFYGLRDFGANKNLKYATNFINQCSKLSRSSVINIFNNLYNRATAGYSVVTIKLHSNVLAELNAEDIAIATNKGWIVS